MLRRFGWMPAGRSLIRAKECHHGNVFQRPLARLQVIVRVRWFEQRITGTGWWVVQPLIAAKLFFRLSRFTGIPGWLAALQPRQWVR